MPEYIEREALKKAVHASDLNNREKTALLLCVGSAPAADVAPVVHGRWIWADDGYLRCSQCGQKAPVLTQYQDEPMTTATDYCPNCGAKMDGEERE